LGLEPCAAISYAVSLPGILKKQPDLEIIILSAWRERDTSDLRKYFFLPKMASQGTEDEDIVAYGGHYRRNGLGGIHARGSLIGDWREDLELRFV